jgi:hypothetical protein
MNDDQIDEQLRTAIVAEPIDTAALDARIRHELNRGSIRRGKWIAALSLAAMLAMAVGGYRVLAHRDATICTDALRDHRIEVSDHAPRKWLNDPAAVLSLASSRGLPAAPVAAIAPAGFRFEHGRLCRLGGQVFLHLVYTDGAQEVSIYLRKRDASGAPGIINQGNVAIENARGIVAVVVTDGSHGDAAEMARHAAMMSS